MSGYYADPKTLQRYKAWRFYQFCLRYFMQQKKTGDK